MSQLPSQQLRVPQSLRRHYGMRFASLTLTSVFVINGVRAQQHGTEQAPGADSSRISDEYIPLLTEGYPHRPRPLLELGNQFLGPGPLSSPWQLPTGQISSPTLMVWGTFRSGYSVLNRGNATVNRDRSVWANRLDLFAEGRLSPTERVVVGIRPLDQDGELTGYDFEANDNVDATNLDINTLFFEGDFGEIFPGLDREDRRALDYGFGVGRQPVNYQDGILINDVLDSVTLTRNSLRFLGMSNFLISGLVAWDNINRGNSVEDNDATLFGVMTASDFDWSFVQVDAAVTTSSDRSRGDGFYFGVGATQRIGEMNSTFRVNLSHALDDDNPAVQTGVLTTAQLSWEPHHTEDNFYVSGFLAIDEFTSAARAAGAGGPLGIMGITFAATGLGGAGAPISSRANEVVGGAVGFQKLLDHGSQQLVFELGGRATTKSGRDDSTACFGTRYQTAWGQHAVLLADVFAGYDRVDDGFLGARLEFLWKF